MKNMKTNTKLSLVFVLGIILPVLLVLLNGYLVGKNSESWSKSNLNNISTTLLTLAILACAAIIVINYRGKKVSFWYTLSIASAVGLGLLLYAGLSVSSFGF